MPAASAPRRRPVHAGALRAAATSADDPSLAVIVNSGSTNVAGYTLRVRDDGWTTLEQAGATQHKRVDKALAARFFADLRAAGPLGALPRAMCMKSTSFGSVTTVAYRGARSPDLSCPGSSSAADRARAPTSPRCATRPACRRPRRAGSRSGALVRAARYAPARDETRLRRR